MKRQMIKCSGPYLEKNAIGYYKPRYMCLINRELYLYKNKTSNTPIEILVLTPGVFITSLSKFHLKEPSDI